MKVRMKFQKYGAMKFIGHLDVLRYFQKAFRRAGFDIEYTKGYSPRQIISFAAPLGVGLTSDAEYVDISLLSSDTSKVMLDRINSVMTEGFRVTGFYFLKEREEHKKAISAMSLVSSADYSVSLKDGYASGFGLNREVFMNKFMEFLARPEILVYKKSKTKEEQVDIRPMITMAAFSLEDYEDRKRETLKDIPGVPSSKVQSMADIYENGIKVYLQLDTGSSSNLKPELVMEAFLCFIGMEYKSYAWQVHRMEIYTKEKEGGKLIPLDISVN